MAQPRILFYDLETSHNVVASFDIFVKDGIPFENILQERFVICAGWKWLGEREVHVASVTDTPKWYDHIETCDRPVLTKLYTAMEEADIIVAHNGDEFDIKFLNARALKLSLPPLPPIQSVDTLKIARRYFRFNSNRLDYLAQFLGLGKKIKIPNREWLKILRGESSAVKKMVRYNKMDVRLLERVYMKLRPWAPMMPVFAEKGKYACPVCFGTRTKSRGQHVTATRQYQRRVCLKCGKSFPARNLKGQMERVK